MKNLKICLLIFGLILFGVSSYLLITNIFSSHGIEVSNARFNIIPNGGGVFLDIYNGLDREICLVSADILDVDGEKVMIHQTIMEGGVEKMVMVDKICIGPKTTVKLERGGYHIMVMNTDLKNFETIKVKLIFDDGEEVIVEAKKVLTG